MSYLSGLAFRTWGLDGWSWTWLTGPEICRQARRPDWSRGLIGWPGGWTDTQTIRRTLEISLHATSQIGWCTVYDIDVLPSCRDKSRHASCNVLWGRAHLIESRSITIKSFSLLYDGFFPYWKELNRIKEISEGRDKETLYPSLHPSPFIHCPYRPRPFRIQLPFAILVPFIESRYFVRNNFKGST